MIPLFGAIFLVTALLAVILQLLLPARFYKNGAQLVFFLVLAAFLCLIYSYIVSDFSVINVYNNSNILKPLLYKITGSWGNHEGSMLLLVLILCGYNLTIAYNKRLSANINETAYLTQLLITAGFLAFLIVTSNPFERVFPAPTNGLGLNPLLQDVGLAIHPPMLYLGYISFSVVFSYAIAALIHNDTGVAWAKTIHNITILGWSFLSLGIGLGSWWAYRELGWGGFWFWDPVENVSLMPWLAATALYHSLIALEKRGAFAMWAVLLSIITFCLSLIGIFLVRSGVVTSVHSFASDPSRGVFILGFLGLTGTLAFGLFATRAGKITSNNKYKIISRETLLLLNNIFFVTLATTVLLGTIYPIFLEVLSDIRVSVGAPYFNINFNYIALLMLVFAALVPFIAWSDGKKFILQAKIHLPPLIVGAVTAIITYTQNGNFITITALTIAAILLTGTAALLFKSKRLYAMILGHAGAAVLVIGITITSFFGVEKEQVLAIGEKIDFAGYTAKLTDSSTGTGKNYLFRQSNFQILHENNEITRLSPEIRFYPVEVATTLEAAIYYSLLSNIYIAVGEIDQAGTKFATRVYYKPMINLIWLGCIMITIGGAWSRMTKYN